MASTQSLAKPPTQPQKRKQPRGQESQTTRVTVNYDDTKERIRVDIQGKLAVWIVRKLLPKLAILIAGSLPIGGLSYLLYRLLR
jgi:hypothetical protein